MPIIFPLAAPDIFAPGPSDSHQPTSHTIGDRVTWEFATCVVGGWSRNRQLVDESPACLLSGGHPLYVNTLVLYGTILSDIKGSAISIISLPHKDNAYTNSYTEPLFCPVFWPRRIRHQPTRKFPNRSDQRLSTPPHTHPNTQRRPPHVPPCAAGTRSRSSIGSRCVYTENPHRPSSQSPTRRAAMRWRA